jgi:hypothetical protein
VEALQCLVEPAMLALATPLPSLRSALDMASAPDPPVNSRDPPVNSRSVNRWVRGKQLTVNRRVQPSVTKSNQTLGC